MKDEFPEQELGETSVLNCTPAKAPFELPQVNWTGVDEECVFGDVMSHMEDEEGKLTVADTWAKTQQEHRRELKRRMRMMEAEKGQRFGRAKDAP